MCGRARAESVSDKKFMHLVRDRPQTLLRPTAFVLTQRALSELNCHTVVNDFFFPFPFEDLQTRQAQELAERLKSRDEPCKA